MPNPNVVSCVPQVPPPSEGTEEIATIHLSGRGGGREIDEKKQVLIQRVGNGTFLQTDKPIYMPGQLGKKGSALGDLLALCLSVQADVL